MKDYKFRHIYPLLLFVISLLMSMASCAGAQRSIVSSGLGKAGDLVPFMEKARTGVLPSGLRYYLLENTTPEARAFLTLAVDAGSVLEAEDDRKRLSSDSRLLIRMAPRQKQDGRRCCSSKGSPGTTTKMANSEALKSTTVRAPGMKRHLPESLR